ncbi:molybdate ABC transporter substrate-binding protein [Luethyella okanaganae]|uniref:Molybdate ABC transporter substrate-binding protein n=1 Tax=Luethyella okanaganae TaxID=69372 RepID=A0ABW1VCV8_9MICO
MSSPVRRRVSGVFVATALAVALGGCSAPTERATTGTGAAADELSGTLTVYAAASLVSVFDELAGIFEERHPAVDVLPISYDGSSILATQIVEGASVDLFASADERSMAIVADAGLLAGGTELFASNTLRIAVPTGNPAGVTGLADLARPDVSTVVCVPAVPCGAASAKLLDRAGVSVTPVSEEQNVAAVLGKVRSGEADAGLVYATDVAIAARDVEGIVPVGASDVVNHYPLAVLANARNPAAARAFARLVLGDAGQKTLTSFGFGAP